MTTQGQALTINTVEVEPLTKEQAEYLAAFLKVYGAWFPGWRIEQKSHQVEPNLPW